MSQKIQVRRGTDAARQTITFDLGEPVFTTDSKKFYIGDGSTFGGVAVAGAGANIQSESFFAIIPNSGTTSALNGSMLTGAIFAAKTKRPFGNPLSDLNRYSILLYPGFYVISTNYDLNQTKYVDLIGVGQREDIILSAPESFSASSGECKLKNLYLRNSNIGLDLNAGGKAISGLEIEDCYLFASNALELSSPISNSKFTNVKMHGAGFTQASFATYPLTGCIINNCQINDFAGTSSFVLYTYGAWKYNKILNCEILSPASAPFINFGFGLDNTNLIKNCYLSGVDYFNDDAGMVAFPNQPIIEDCHFDGNIYSFHGRMSNCTVDNTNSNPATQPIALNNISTTIYPSFYNCTVLASNSVNQCVTGNAVNRSGLFSNCRFNKFVQTGVTGYFGNQFNIVHASIK